MLQAHTLRYKAIITTRSTMRWKQANGREDAPAEVEGMEVPSPFTASVWEVSGIQSLKSWHLDSPFAAPLSSCIVL